MKFDENGDLCGKVLTIVEEFSHLNDLHILLDKVLLEARRLTNADAGSIYLIENNVLSFNYIQNDTLFSSSSSNKYIYANHVLVINNESLAGYVALTGEPLIIADAYRIPELMPFKFNASSIKLPGISTNRFWPSL